MRRPTARSATQSTARPTAIEQALHAGPFGQLDEAARDRVISIGIVTELAEGRVQPPWHVAPTIVIEGLVRLRVRTDMGREWTLRYVEPGGTAHFSFPAPEGVHLQALTDSVVLVLNRHRLQQWMAWDASFASAVAAAIASEHEGLLAEVTGTALRPLRARVCNHLLYLAQRSARVGGRVELTHQDLASTVGSVRDVVTRILDDLRDAGAIELRRGSIVVRNAERLRAIRDSWDGGTNMAARRQQVTAVT